MKAPWSYIPALPAAIGIVGGIITADFIDPIILVVIGIATFIMLYAFKRQYLAFVALFFGIGALMMDATAPIEGPEGISEGNHQYVGEIETSSPGKKATSYIIKINQVDGAEYTPWLCKVTVFSVSNPLIRGTLVSFKGQVKPIDRVPKNPTEPDYTRYLQYEGVTTQAAVNFINVRQPAGIVNTTVERWRQNLYDWIVLSPIDGETAAFLVAAALGDDRLITPEQYDQYRMTGIAHILALSGLHVGILVTLLSFLLFPLINLRRGTLLRSLLTVAVVWIYVLIVGFTPSIVRAAVMVSVFVAARYLQRGYSPFNSLLLAVIIILCINPRWIYTPGFQLSVSAVAAILMFGGTVPLSYKRRPWVYYLLNLMVMPIAAMLGTGIVSAYHFHIFPGLFLLSNIVVGILFPWILMGGVILGGFTALGIRFAMLGYMVDSLYAAMQWCVDGFAQASFAQITDIYFSAWVILPYMLTLCGLAWWLRRLRGKYKS